MSRADGLESCRRKERSDEAIHLLVRMMDSFFSLSETSYYMDHVTLSPSRYLRLLDQVPLPLNFRHFFAPCFVLPALFLYSLNGITSYLA
jgi:hypothetical protein